MSGQESIAAYQCWLAGEVEQQRSALISLEEAYRAGWDRKGKKEESPVCRTCRGRGYITEYHNQVLDCPACGNTEGV